ncbi:MAG TPA: hypothetical protein PLU53_02190 [Bacteroidia bacterium]|nr:hypothetical protein [Bacteroidia bacterium]
MKIRLLIPVLAIAIVSFGCGSNDKQNPSSETTDTDTLHGEHATKTAEEVAGKLSLDNGNKWQANSETTEGIQKMQKLVEEQSASASVDYTVLSENLEAEFGTILQKCTMQGDAHNQLHNFLLPLNEMIEKLKTKPGKETIKEIQDHLAVYPNYFQ